MPTPPFAASILILSLFMLLPGCGSVETPARLGQLEESLGGFQLPLAVTPSVDPVEFAGCMAPETAKLKLGFGQLVGKLKSQAENGLLLNPLGLLDGANLTEHALQARAHLQTLIDRFEANPMADLAGMPASGISENIRRKAEEIAANMRQHPLAAQQDVQLLKKLGRAYLTTYFTKPVNVDARRNEADNALREEIAAILKRNPNDQKITALLDMLQPRLKPSWSNVAGFIDRDGSRFGFTGLSASGADGSKVDHSQIGADVMRIFLDALRDTLAPLPVLAYSTAGEFPAEFDVLTFQNADRPIGVDWHIDRHDPAKAIRLSLSARQFEYIQATAKQAEASAASSVGKAIRGGAAGSLNNEALARQLETAAGVLARHAAERLQWCLLAQGKL